MITITKQPNNYSPSNNSIVWEFATDNDETLYFNIIVRQTQNSQSSGVDPILSKNKIYIPPASNKSHIDISRVLDNLTSTQVTNTDNQIENLDGVVSYYLEIKGVNAKGEITDETIFSDPFHAYNGGVNLYKSLEPANTFLHHDSIGECLTSFGTEIKLHHSNRFHLYFLANNTSHLAYFQQVINFKTGTQQIRNIAFTNHRDKNLHRLQISVRKIAEEFDVLESDINSIYVTAYSSANQPMTEEFKFYNVSYPCGTSTVNIHWENTKGGYDSYAFINPKKSISVERQTIKTNQLLSKENGIYSPLTRTVKVNKTINYNVTTAKLSDTEFDVLAEIIASKNVYVETLAKELIPIHIQETNINILQKRFTKEHNRMAITFAVPDTIDINTITDVDDVGFDYVLDITF